MTRKIVTVIVIATAIFAGRVAAHHSFAAEFDADSPIDLTGVVTKVEWMNPHTFFYIDVENEDGSYDNWALELGSPNGLARRGWSRDSMQIGDEVSVAGTRAKNGSLKGNARTVELADGTRLFAGTSQPDVEGSEQ